MDLPTQTELNMEGDEFAEIIRYRPARWLAPALGLGGGISRGPPPPPGDDGPPQQPPNIEPEQDQDEETEDEESDDEHTEKQQSEEETEYLEPNTETTTESPKEPTIPIMESDEEMPPPTRNVVRVTPASTRTSPTTPCLLYTSPSPRDRG